jgi:transposase
VFKPHDRGLAISRGPFSAIFASACFPTYRLSYLQAVQAFAMAPKGPHDNGPRVQALTLLSKGFKPDEIKADTGLSKSTIYDLQKRALSRGYDPSKDRKILIAYVEDTPKVGRPKKCKDWLKVWKDLPQKKIQEWIERIPEYIQKIIELEGGNKYKEGRNKRKRNPNRVR